MNAPEYLKDYGDNCLPLILNAQEALIEQQAEAFKAAKQIELEGFVFQYAEAQRKKRKKKLRIARLEKNEEELAFEAERSVYEERRVRCRRCARSRSSSPNCTRVVRAR